MSALDFTVERLFTIRRSQNCQYREKFREAHEHSLMLKENGSEKKVYLRSPR